MRPVPWLLLLPLLLAPCAVLDAASSRGGVQNVVLSDNEIDQQFTDRRKELAAEYRVDRARIIGDLPDSYHRKAEEAQAAVVAAMQLGDLPRMRIFQTSKKMIGQIYVPTTCCTA